MALIVSEEVKQQRLALCEVCPHRRENIPGREEKHRASSSLVSWSIEKDKCNLCGCYMPVKAKMKYYPNGDVVSCPAKKWQDPLRVFMELPQGMYLFGRAACSNR